MKEHVQADSNDKQKHGEITVELKGCQTEGHTYRRRQGLQIDGREGEVEKRENYARVEQADEIKEGVMIGG